MMSVRIGEFEYTTPMPVDALNIDAYLSDVLKAFERFQTEKEKTDGEA